MVYRLCYAPRRGLFGARLCGLCIIVLGLAVFARPGAADMDEDLRAMPPAQPTTSVPVIASRRVETGPQKRLAHARIVIRSNIYRDGLEQNVPVEVMTKAIRLFAHAVDFQRDIVPGDSFEIYLEQTTDSETGQAAENRIIFAAITTAGRTLTLWRYTTPDGTTDYYNSDGSSARLHLMRSPVEGAELSSGFGPRRHPILGFTRMHKGIDFAAKSGTPIYAAGAGVVEMAKRNGGYGNYVRLRHSDKFQTAYAHLLRFASGLRPGDKVRQGQVIGYVGTSGLSTGPHLHYEVLKDGKQTDPRALRLAPQRVLAGKDLAAFRWYAALLDIRPTVRPVAIVDHPGVR